jgi:pimeloyl-ACP methyl ester carboxylesterase
MLWRKAVWLVIVLALSAGPTVQAWADASPRIRQMCVNGVDLFYCEQGTGTPVVFVHGAFSDLRYWEAQRLAVARQYRFIAYTYRYHGTALWPNDGQHYSSATHAADLGAFLRQLDSGSVHLVGLSMGGELATRVALEHPDLVRSLTVLEPGFRTLLTDLPEAKSVLDERSKAFEPIRTAAKTGDALRATKLMFDWVNNQGSGAFDRQPEAVRQMILDNARTVPLMFSAPPPPAISCATLSAVKAPILVIRGAQTRRYYSLITEVLVRCIPGSQLVTIPNATHLMSHQNPVAFNEALLQFLGQH